MLVGHTSYNPSYEPTLGYSVKDHASTQPSTTNRVPFILSPADTARLFGTGNAVTPKALELVTNYMAQRFYMSSQVSTNRINLPINLYCIILVMKSHSHYHTWFTRCYHTWCKQL